LAVNMDGTWYYSDATWNLFQEKIENVPFLSVEINEAAQRYPVPVFDLDYSHNADDNAVTMTTNFNMELMAPYLAQVVRDGGYVVFMFEDFESMFPSNLFTSFARDNQAEFLALINQYLEEDEQLTEWVFNSGMYGYHDGIVVGIKK